MSDSPARRIVRIGVFYDGYYFSHVSNYYFYHHERRSRISLTGLHTFLREEVARREGTDARYCQIVESHYFRGRLGAADAAERDILMKERQFEDVLVREGVVPHYVALQLDADGAPRRDKGIDVWFALEAFEGALLKKLDVVVIVASDSDYVPLARKLNTLGARVMVLAWDFRFTGQDNETRETRTSQALLSEVSYPVLMSQVIDDRTRRYDPLVKELSELGVNIGPLLAGVGVVGLAIGFGAQKLVQDVINGAFIQFENSLNEGDVVEVGGISGVVERVTIRSVALRSLDGTYHVIPFSAVDTVSNLMKHFSFHVAAVNVTYRESIPAVKDAMREAFRRLKETPHAANSLGDFDMQGVVEFTPSAVVVRGRIKTLPGKQWDAGRAYNELVKTVFDERGIAAPYPHMRLQVYGDDPASAGTLPYGPGHQQARSGRPPAGEDDAAPDADSAPAEPASPGARFPRTGR